jgi:hypothetical protein
VTLPIAHYAKVPRPEAATAPAGYFGDMPHSWIGVDYVRAVIRMLMHEADDHLELLPGTPPTWLVGDGAGVSDLPTTTNESRQSLARAVAFLPRGSEVRLKFRFFRYVSGLKSTLYARHTPSARAATWPR